MKPRTNSLLVILIAACFAAANVQASGSTIVKAQPKPSPQKKAKLPVIPAAVKTRIAALQRKALSSINHSVKVSPTLQWKYGYRDGKKSNLIGRAASKALLPAAMPLLGNGYSPSDLASAYGFDQLASTNDGTAQTIAIVVAYGNTNIQTDLNSFCGQYGIPTNSVSVVYPSGAVTNADSGWAGETSLDVEWAHAMAPGANLLLVVSPDDSVANMLAAVAYASTNANVVSMSWSAPESRDLSTQYDGLFAVPGVTFVAAAGDAGAGVNWPASSTNVLAVGGTTLSTDWYGNINESAWSGSAGGISTVEQIPAWQVGWNINYGRGVPDVAYDADPYTGVSVYFTDPTLTNSGGWYVFGGTSAGTPQWAALAGRRGQLLSSNTNSLNAVLYGNANTNYSGLFNDITTGWNGYPAVLGYDLVTGLGTPVAQQIALLPNAVPSATNSPSPTPAPSPVIHHGPGGSGPSGGSTNSNNAPVVEPTPPSGNSGWDDGNWGSYGSHGNGGGNCSGYGDGSNISSTNGWKQAGGHGDGYSSSGGDAYSLLQQIWQLLNQYFGQGSSGGTSGFTNAPSTFAPVTADKVKKSWH